MRFLKLFGRRQPPSSPVAEAVVFPPLSPEEPLMIFGDLHGRADLLERLLVLHDRHLPEFRLVALGDYIDRGDESARVIELLRQAATQHGLIALRGNHEAMLIDFLDDPAAGSRWLAHGGLSTLASFGILGLPEKTPEALTDLRDQLRTAMGPETELWLRNLPAIWQSGNLAAVHAGADPARPLSEQNHELIWGHPAFRHVPRQDGIWIAHGHTVVDRARAQDGRISLDTGAYATDRLSYALIDPSRAEYERLTITVVPAGPSPENSDTAA